MTFVASCRFVGHLLKAWLAQRPGCDEGRSISAQGMSGMAGAQRHQLRVGDRQDVDFVEDEQRLFVVTLSAGELQDVLLGSIAVSIGDVCGTWSPDEVPDTDQGHAVVLDLEQRLAMAAPNVILLVHKGMTPQVRALEHVIYGVAGHRSAYDVCVVSADELSQSRRVALAEPDTELAC